MLRHGVCVWGWVHVHVPRQRRNTMNSREPEGGGRPAMVTTRMEDFRGNMGTEEQNDVLVKSVAG